jgi:flagellar basal-body rod protein FlgB
MFQAVAANSERYMTLISERQKLVASNIANVDTPGYKTKDIDFRAEFENAISSEAPTAPMTVDVNGLPVKADGNNVNLDREARLLAENSLRFAVASNFAHGELSTLKSAMQDVRSS